MTKIWNSRQNVKNAVETIAKIHKNTGMLPPELIIAYKKLLISTSKGMVMYFYELLAIYRPEALPLFLGDEST